MTEPTEPTVEPSANTAHAQIIEHLTNLNKSAQEAANAQRTSLAQIEELIRQREVAIEALQGRKITAQRAQGKDPVRSARARWSQAKRRGKPKAEVDRLEREFRALKRGQ